MRFKEEMNDRMWKFSRIVLRIGLSLVFLWFGIKQIVDPQYLISYLPSYFQTLPISATNIMLINGFAETILGALLLAGYYVRTVSFLLSLHLIFITFSVGYNEIGVRDFGLLIATVSVFLNGKDSWCLQKKGERKH